MSILLLEAYNLRKSFADRLVLDIDVFRIYAGERIGFIGANGSGKSTLLDILAGTTEPDEGVVRRYCDTAYIKQFDYPGGTDNTEETDAFKLRLFGVENKIENDTVSGGEATRIKIANVMHKEHRLIFADEPTSNLDIEGVALFGQELERLESFVLVSHDRDLLNKYCNKIIALENGNLAIYEGGFEEYRLQVEMKKEKAMTDYEEYELEKSRLQKVYVDKKVKAAKVTKKPKGMSSSEMKQRDFIATSRSFDGRQRSFERAARAVQARIDHMEIKERPNELPRIKLDFTLTEPPVNKIVLSGKNINLGYDNLLLLENASFDIKNNARIALTGPNGSGKTTLLNTIYNDDRLIYRVPKARLGYFYQGFEQIDLSKTVLQNALSDSIQREAVVRSVLARLLFTRNDVNKPAGVLSGGERIKLSFAMLLVSMNNILLLDEPTNYLDMPSIEVLQSILTEYEGTLIFVSHDRAFVNAVCTELLIIKDGKLLVFEGNLDAYTLKHTNRQDNTNKMVLEHRLAALAGEITLAKNDRKDALVEEYMALTRELNRT